MEGAAAAAAASLRAAASPRRRRIGNVLCDWKLATLAGSEINGPVCLRAARPEGGKRRKKKLGETQRCSYSSARMTSRDDPCVTEHFIIGSAK